MLNASLRTVGRTPWVSDQPIARLLSKKDTNTKKPQTHMGFEPMTPAFERAMTVHLLLLLDMTFQHGKEMKELHQLTISYTAEFAAQCRGAGRNMVAGQGLTELK
jgi:hypothetical protein